MIVLQALPLMACGRLNYDALDTSVIDADLIDAEVPLACGPMELSAGVIAHYPFETQTIDDGVGNHDGRLVGTAQALGNASPCGGWLELGPSLYGVIPDSSEWDLAEGSLDLWVRPDAPPPTGSVGILARDAFGKNEAGHILLGYMSDGRIIVRIQAVDGGGAPDIMCSESALAVGEWVHIGVNFGLPDTQLFIDGIRHQGLGGGSIGPNDYSCNRTVGRGIATNRNPWGIGVALHDSADGSEIPVIDPYTGAVDELRISSTRRDFSILNR